MSAAPQSDCFVVVNGPEDGTEFPVVRTPFYIGQDPSCAAHIRLDNTVQPFHALVTGVSEGYRVRSLNAAPVFVGGKRAGMLRSRTIRSSGYIQVGHTILAVECAPDGLANRSRGIVSESDFGWALRQGARALLTGAFRLARALIEVCTRLLTSWLTILAILILLYLLWPGFRFYVNGILQVIYYRLIFPVLHRFTSTS